MSDWADTLQTRSRELERALEALEDANDHFLDHAEERKLEQAQTEIQDVLDVTESELAVTEADWRLIEDHAETILGLLEDAAVEMEDAGLADYTGRHLQPVLDDEPTAIHDTRNYIDGALKQWHEVLSTASDMAEETSGGVY